MSRPIDLANHVIRTARIGIPSDSSESFSLLAKAGIIGAELAARLRRMVGFQNAVVHEYQLGAGYEVRPALGSAGSRPTAKRASM